MTWLSQIFGFLKSFQFWIVVAPWEQALRVRLGKAADVLRPGVHLRLPFLDRIFVQSVRLRSISDSGQTMTTKDGHVLTLSVAVFYAIEDIGKLFQSVSHPESTLLFQVQGLVSEFIGKTNRSDILPSDIEKYVTDNMPATEWGLGQVKMTVVTFAYVRVYRLLQHEYRNTPNDHIENAV